MKLINYSRKRFYSTGQTYLGCMAVKGFIVQAPACPLNEMQKGMQDNKQQMRQKKFLPLKTKRLLSTH